MINVDMTTPVGRLPDGRYLDSLNDRGVSFEEIADIIEKNYENFEV